MQEKLTLLKTYTTMKKLVNTLFAIVLFASIAFAISCSEEDLLGIPTENTWNFLSQNVQGTIEGVAFSLGEGKAEESFSNSSDLSINLYNSNEVITEVCDFFNNESVEVFFDIPAEVGLYELFIDLSALDGQTVTMFNPVTSVNTVAAEGAVEITSITDTEVSGRIDARAGETSVNGNFTITYCSE